jgi:hypothetical protein
MKKADIIKKIQSNIKKKGSFSANEIEIDGEVSSPCINEMGGLIALAEYFDKKEVTVEVYEPSSMSSDSMHSYTVKYDELDVFTLNKILVLSNKYETELS